MCLEENTRIFMADGSQKPIREIRIGEEVMSDSGKTQRVMNVWQGKMVQKLHLLKTTL